MIKVWLKYPESELVLYAEGVPAELPSGNDFVMMPFSSPKPLYLNLNKQTIIYPDDLVSPVFEMQNAPELNALTYTNLVANGIAAIKDKKFKKVVLARQKIFKSNKNPLEIFKTLCRVYPNCLVHLVYHNNGYCSIGASPELLLLATDGLTSSVSMAGTVSSQNPRFTSKEIEEQAIVTDYVVAQFEQMGLQPELEHQTIQNGAIKHLYSSIVAKVALKLTERQALLQMLHPTPAVCGFPKSESEAFILESEGFDRQFYAGYLGVITPEKTHCFVNLRCGKLFADGAVLTAGAGITAESEPEKEFKETAEKLKVLGTYL